MFSLYLRSTVLLNAENVIHMFSLLARYGHNKNIFYVFFFFFFFSLGASLHAYTVDAHTLTHWLLVFLPVDRLYMYMYSITEQNQIHLILHQHMFEYISASTFLSPRNGYLTVDLLLLLSSLMRYVLQCAYFLELRNIEHNFETTQKK